jgi:hypothetical protein
MVLSKKNFKSTDNFGDKATTAKFLKCLAMTPDVASTISVSQIRSGLICHDSGHIF